MDINLIPFGAFSLESVPASGGIRPSNTLTLALSWGAVETGGEGMTGTAFGASADSHGSICAGVLPANTTSLTITFPVETTV